LNDDLSSHNTDKDGDQNTMSPNGQLDGNANTQEFPQCVYHQLLEYLLQHVNLAPSNLCQEI
jgi:hypothetical protein